VEYLLQARLYKVIASSNVNGCRGHGQKFIGCMSLSNIPFCMCHPVKLDITFGSTTYSDTGDGDLTVNPARIEFRDGDCKYEFWLELTCPPVGGHFDLYGRCVREITTNKTEYLASCSNKPIDVNRIDRLYNAANKKWVKKLQKECSELIP
jgi:hypothetical protein